MTARAQVPSPAADTDDHGPVEDTPWPTRLEAHVVTPGPAPRIHGYDVHDDLARHYGFGEVVLLTLTGQPPSVGVGRVFEAALVDLAPVTVAEAPAHAAVLARLCDADPAGTVATGAIGLAEQARERITRHRAALEALRAGRPWAECDGRCEGADALAEARIAERLRETGLVAPRLAGPVCAEAEGLATLAALGLTEPWQLLAALVVARLPAVAAEAQAVTPRSFPSYPMNLPPFVYGVP